MFDIEGKETRLKEIEITIAGNGFWDNPDGTTAILKERTSLTDKITIYTKLKSDLEECDILMDLAIEESDADTVEEVTRSIADIQDRARALSLKLMLDGDDDEKNAIVSINAGAGGTEAQDWAEMLFRMYARWVERKGYKLNVIDYQ
ncbi:MAG: PCRF domain-containing protein, partial [Deltaproteobacteria bacterium]|nr:PCRF domain-containing protein [Deltaproteobacteria bacterium]